ncbi:hypothetical protein IMCC3317_18930 [Kordia antarctica]|uniref:Calx-beta domain-containing protein n=1 Tax=Kordia antarctica TaxID=1218801 RepID=A0A7L4ZJ21_9FLAO|nr:hypothetical protein [Kordia antarctica]QHI36530.1 hypothetical protein IMCC3317_18930 [Kordia antarctica]
MKKIAILFIGVLFMFTSCEETQSPIYDGSQTLAYFNGTSSTLEVEINSTNTIDVSVGVSTTSSSARTVNVSVDADNTTATSGMYSFPTTVTIPANEFFGTLTVMGMDDGLTTSGETLSLKIDSVDGGIGSTQIHTLSLVEICPIDATFATGMYTLDFVSGGIAAAGFAPALGTAINVELVGGTASTERTFNVKCYPSFGFSNPPVDFSFSFVCGTTTSKGLLDGQVSGVGCGGSIAFGPATSLGSYTVGDDTSITFIFDEDIDEICGSVATTTYTLTKI